MTDFMRTPDENFADLSDFPYAPRYHTWQDLRLHYVDEGPRDAPVMLLLHGMPTWAYLYRDMIPLLVDAGYRCIAPDHMGFGRGLKGVVMGDAATATFVPYLADLHRAGQLPYDRFVRYYDFADIERAIHDSSVTGEVIKPILTMP